MFPKKIFTAFLVLMLSFATKAQCDYNLAYHYYTDGDSLRFENLSTGFPASTVFEWEFRTTLATDFGLTEGETAAIGLDEFYYQYLIIRLKAEGPDLDAA